MATSGQSIAPQAQWATMPVSCLLLSTYAVVPFVGREELLRDLVAWATDAAEVRVRVVHGDGGLGKTRLALNLCMFLRGIGHRAGMLKSTATAADVEELLRTSTTPTTVVVDYAEWNTDLRKLLIPLASAQQGTSAPSSRASPRAPFRLLLLARNAGGWLHDLMHYGAEHAAMHDLLSDRKPENVSRLTPAERVAHFEGACQAFAQVRNATAVVPVRVPSLVDALYGRPLYVHMAALVAVLGTDVHGPDAVLEAVLEHEAQVWHKHFSAQMTLTANGAFIENLRQLVAFVTLFGGVSSEGLDVLACHVNSRLATDLAQVVSKVYADPAGRVAPLEPDLLGEELVRATLAALGDHAGNTLHRLGAGAEPSALRAAFSVLGRIAVAATRPWIQALLAQDLPGRALVALDAALAIASDGQKHVRRRTVFSPLGQAIADELERAGANAALPTLATPTPSTKSANTTRTARGCCRTTPRRCAGIAERPTPGTATPCAASAFTTPTASAWHRTSPRRRAGTAARPTQAIATACAASAFASRTAGAFPRTTSRPSAGAVAQMKLRVKHPHVFVCSRDHEFERNCCSVVWLARPPPPLPICFFRYR